MSTMSRTTQMFKLNTGAAMPAVGLGTWKSPPDEVRKAVCHALRTGYRHIDTALNYQNEVEVGQGIRDSGIPRHEIWVTTKLDNPWHHRVREGFEKSLSDLGIGQEMQKLLKTHKVKNIGVSNFQIRHLEKLLNDPSCTVVPAVNQIELHPGNPSPTLLAFCKSKGIHATAYSCLGGATDNPLYKDQVLSRLVQETGKSAAQILLMWSLQRDTSIIPKSVNPARIESNFKLDGWTLTDSQLKALNAIRTRFKVVNDSWMPIQVFFGDDE